MFKRGCIAAAAIAGGIANTDGMKLSDITLMAPGGSRLKTEDNVKLQGPDSVQYR